MHLPLWSASEIVAGELSRSLLPAERSQSLLNLLRRLQAHASHLCPRCVKGHLELKATFLHRHDLTSPTLTGLPSPTRLISPSRATRWPALLPLCVGLPVLQRFPLVYACDRHYPARLWRPHLVDLLTAR